MMDKIKDIWKDPVWSKVISVGILGVIAFIYAKIKSIYEEQTLWDTIYGLLITIYSFEIRIIYVVTIVVFYIIIKTIYKNQKVYYRRQIFKNNVNKLKDINQGILVKWDVYFDVYDKPQVSSIESFCLKHGEPPLKMYKYGGCIDHNCQNSQIKYDGIRSIVESIVINEWDKINNKSL